MKVAGIIAEYNPFHNGHIYHIEKTKEITGADYVVVIMSGNFIQRGGPAIIDKWTRSKLAVVSGVDLVIELPFVYSSQTAEIFASGAIRILDSTNTIDYLSFGAETENIDNLKQISHIIVSEPDTYKSKLKQLLKTGVNYPKARESALESFLNRKVPEISKSNNILAIEYLKSLEAIDSSLIPISICRNISNHNDNRIHKDISSATSIRKSILNNYSDCQTEGIDSRSIIEMLKNSIPNSTADELLCFYNKYNNFNSFNNFLDIIVYKIIMEKHLQSYNNIKFDNYIKNDSDNIFDLDSDMKNRLFNIVTSLEDSSLLLENIKSKNHTMTRIRRSLINLLVNLTVEDMELFKDNTPNYIRVLASNSNGFKILNKVKSNSNLQIINKFSEINHTMNPIDKIILNYEILATNLYYLTLNKGSFNMEYKTSPYIEKL